MTPSSRITLAAALFLLPVSVAGAETVVYPTGHWPADVYSVQAAVNEGGRVLLKATTPLGTPTPFDFGPGTAAPRRVDLGLLGRDVEIHGETVSGAMTTILGGLRPLRHTAGARVKIGIHGIHFEAPMLEAIYLDNFTVAEIVGNVITNVRPTARSRFATTESRPSAGHFHMESRSSLPRRQPGSRAT